MANMAQIAQMLIDADRALTSAKATLDALRASAQRIIMGQASEQGAAPTWKVDGASVSLDGWSTPPRATIVNEHLFATEIQGTEIPGEDLDRYVQGTITLPLPAMRALMQYMDPWTADEAVTWGLTDAGKAWAGVALQVVDDETVLVDPEDGTILDGFFPHDVPGTGVTRVRPRLVVRRPGKAAEQREAAETASAAIAELEEAEGE